MKKIYIILATITVQTLISANLSMAQSIAAHCNDQYGITGETNQIDFGNTILPTNPFVYDERERDEGKINFRDNFFYRNEGNHIANPEFKVTVANLITLLNVLRTPGPSRPAYVPAIHHGAVKMHYGIDINTNTMVLIFEPVLLIPKPDESCDVIYTQQYFRLGEDGNITPLPSENDFTTLRDNYLNNVYILHRGWRNMFTHDFIDIEHSWRSDTKSCVMPLQQIFKMYCDNKTSSPTDGDPISFQIIANNYYRHNRSYKVHVVASYRMGRTEENGTFRNLAADFTQLCPPNCSPIWNYKSPDKNVRIDKKKEEREK